MKKKSSFLSGLDADLQKSLIEQLHLLWTHSSTALEGNTLTLGETQQVLLEGLTISGKPLKDHNEVMGHAKAITLMNKLVADNKTIEESDLFILHQAIQTESKTDVYDPIGAWKKEPNSTNVVINDKATINDTYALPKDVPDLMKQWLADLNTLKNNPDISSYVYLHAAFVRIHPFSDGNGRMARLVANIPFLSGGHPPLIIDRTHRLEYISTLALWQLSVGRIEPGQEFVPQNEDYKKFQEFCENEWNATQKIINDTFEIQKKRTP